jgi:alanine racemase
MSSRPFSGPDSWIEIKLSSLRKNYQWIRGKTHPSAKIMAVVKADAYGHGLVPIARELIGLGASALAVSSMEEGILIRKKVSPHIPVVLLPGLFPEETTACLHYHLTPIIYSEEIALKLHHKAKRRNIRIPVHIKIDTGMGRLGVPWFEFGDFIKKMVEFKGLQVTGLTSHFGQADNKDNSYNHLQWKRFSEALHLAGQAGLELTQNHMANSAALLNCPKSHLHYVRPGILLYGCNPTKTFNPRRPIGVKPAMTLKSRILQVKRLPAGVEISYGGTYITTRPETIAIIPIGYANGYPRILSNRGEALIQGKRFPIIGRVCMNLIMIRIDTSLRLEIGEEVVLMGSQGPETITPDELAQKSGTIPYEIFCLLGRQNSRKYLGN